MSELWTPPGAREPGDDHRDDHGDDLPAASAPRAEEPSAEELAALREVRERLAATPVTDLIAHHALGLWQLGLLHLGLLEVAETGAAPPSRQPDLASAALAIDALAALLDGVGSRLGPHEQALRDALTRAQMAYVAVADARRAP